MAQPKGPVTFKELTVEEQIVEIQREAQQKIKELQNSLTWDKRFKSAFVPSVFNLVDLDGHGANKSLINEINDSLSHVNLKLEYDSATFDNDMYKIIGGVDDYDLSEYPVYTIFKVSDLRNQLQGYIRIDCQYSSYNGNEYSSWTFVKPQPVTCTIFKAYKP